MAEWDVVKTEPATADPWAVTATEPVKPEAKPEPPNYLSLAIDALKAANPALWAADSTFNVAKHVVPPFVNLLTDIPRNIGADIVAAGYSPPTSKEARDLYWKVRKKSLETPPSSWYHVPETKPGENISEALGVPGKIITQIAGAIGDVTGTREKYGPAAVALADLLPLAGGGLAATMRRGVVPGEAKQAAIENKARREISKRYASTAYEGGPTAVDIIDELGKGRAAGQPVALTDVGNVELGRLTGTAYRQGGGASAQRIKDFFEGRAGEAAQRVGQAISSLFSDASLRNAMAIQAEQRATQGKPLWNKAMERGSTEPFEQAYSKAATETAAAAERARAELRAVEHDKEVFDRQAGSRWSQQTDVERRALDQRLEEKRLAVQPAVVAAERMEQLRAQAVADGTANAPGATWSPGLQRMLDAYPELRGLISHGIAMERRFAADDIVAGRPFNPKDYAIVGVDEAGNAIVGTVPTMRAWHAAKVGLDNTINQPGMRDQFGRLTANGASHVALRNQLVGELDRLNKDYKPARDMWGGDTAIMRAMQEGQETLSETRFRTPEDLREHVAGLGDSEKQAFVTALAQDMQTRLSKITDPRDKSQMINTPFIRDRVRAVVGDATADRFLDMMEREGRMKQAGNIAMSGAQTAERKAADVKGGFGAAADAGKLLSSLWQSRFGEAIRAGGRLGGRITGHIGRTDPRVQSEVGRLMTDPNVQVSPTGPLLPTVPRPKGSRVPSPWWPIGGGAVVEPQIHPDEGLARALQYQR